MEKQITRSNEMEWKPLVEEGVETDGIYVKVLRSDENTPGEEAFILEGEIRFGPDQLNAGDYLYTPPEKTHSVFSRTGCTLLLVIPEEVVIL